MPYKIGAKNLVGGYIGGKQLLKVMCGTAAGPKLCWQAGASSISVDPTASDVMSTGGYVDIAVTADGAWTATLDSYAQQLVSLNKTSGSGNDIVRATFGANTSPEAILGTITFASGSAQAISQIHIDGAWVAIYEASVVLPVAGTAATIHVSASGTWTIAVDNQAFSLSKTSGIGNDSVQVSASQNTGANRSATITLQLGSGVATDTCQAGQYGPFSVSSTSLSFVAAGETKQIDLLAGGAWTAVLSGSGFAISATSGSGNATLEISADPNASTSPRSGSVTINMGDDRNLVVDLSQAAAEAPPSWPTRATGEKAYYNGNSYTYDYTDQGYWWYIADQGEAMPYYVRYDYDNTHLWYNGAGAQLDPPPTQS